MNWIAKIPDILLYPVGWYIVATDWIDDNPHKTFWFGVVGVVLAWVF